MIRRSGLTALAALLALLSCDDDARSDDPADTTQLQPDAAAPDAAPVVTTGLEAAVAAVSATRMKTHMDYLASDALGGRVPGSEGHRVAREYLVAQLEGSGVEPFGDDGTYIHSYPTDGRDDRWQLVDGEVVPARDDTGYNVVGIVRAAQPTDRYVVYMGHYDHLGAEEGTGAIFNGAFDDASGTIVGLELAHVMTQHEAPADCHVIILLTDEEEGGLNGAENWIADPPVPKEQIVVGISGDPLGRPLLPDYAPIVLSGLERSPELDTLFRETGGFSDQDVAFLHRDMIPAFASDQDEFHRQGVPGVWFINPGMTFYHTTDDTAETIDYRVMRNSARYILRAIHHVAAAGRTFPYEGAPEPVPADATDAKVLLVGVRASSVLDDAQRAAIDRYIRQVDEVVAAGSFEPVGNPFSWAAGAVALVAFTLPQAHPGPIPPPFPDE